MVTGLSTDEQGVGRRDAGAWLAAGIVVAILLLAGLPLTLSNYTVGRMSSDQDTYYLAAVYQFAEQWPRPDVSDYPSATTPGWPLALAVVAHYINDSPKLLRTINLLLTCVMLGLLAFSTARRVGPSLGVALTLPVLASLYVFGSAAWMLLDNPAWFWVVVMLLLLWRRRVGYTQLALASVALVLLVLMRQIHLWAAALVWTAAWLGRTEAVVVEPLERDEHPDDPKHGHWKLLLSALLMTLPAFGVIGYFFALWGGPMPRYDDLLRGPNPATPAFILSLAGAFSLFYLPWLWPHVLGMFRDKRARRWLIVIALLGLGIGALPVSTWQQMERVSGLWNLVRVLPTFADRSPVIVLGAGFGAVMLAIWSRGLGGRGAFFFMAAWLAFITAQASSATAWQRYHEPFVLIMFALAASKLIRPVASAGPRRTAQLAALLLLTLLQAAVTIRSLAPPPKPTAQAEPAARFATETEPTAFDSLSISR